MKKTLSLIIPMALVLLTLKAGAVDKLNRADKTNLKKTGRAAKYDPPAKNSRVVSKDYLAELSKNIEYDFARASVRETYNSKLDKLAAVSIENKYALSLRGYADSIGTYKGNWVISDKRANAVKNYLVKKGVDPNQIITTPFGSTKPIATNKTKAGRQKNRRVEIKINEVNN